MTTADAARYERLAQDQLGAAWAQWLASGEMAD